MMHHDNRVKEEEKSKKGGGKFPKKLFGVLIVLIALIADGMFAMDTSNYVASFFFTTPISVPATPSFPFQVNGFNASVNEKLILVQGNITLLLWNFVGQERLCKLISVLNEMRDNETKIMEAIHRYNSSLDRSDFESIRNLIAAPKKTQRRLLINITSHSCNMYVHLGQGHWLLLLYHARMAAALRGVDLQFNCNDREALRMTHLLPWFTGYYPAPQNLTDYFDAIPTHFEACDRSAKLRLDKMSRIIQSDVRAMALRLVGGKKVLGAKHVLGANPVPPLIPDVELDDVVIHFRCGDVMGGERRGDYGIIAFTEYRKWIRPSPSLTVGILTQPFDRWRNRGQDGRRVGQCKRATYLFVDYLRGFLGNDTKISIHNSVNETLPLAYARLVMAKQSFASISTFGIFPVMATFGEGYVQGSYLVNQFADHLPNHLPNLHVMHGPVLTAIKIFYMLNTPGGEDSVMNWLVTAQ